MQKVCKYDNIKKRVWEDSVNAKIFETINTSARRISEFEYVRNNIFLRAGVDNRERLWHKYLAHFEKGDFWTPGIYDQFLQDFLTTKLGIDIKTDKLFDVYERQYRSTLEADQGIEHELAELKQHAEVYQKTYVDISKKIAALTGLKFNERVLVRYDSTTLNRESVLILFNAGLCTDSDAELWDLRRDESEPNFPIENSIMDIFGEYYPNKKEMPHSPAKKEIVIYEKMCQLAAAAMNVDVEVLKEVVIVHEIAHAITHLGKDNDGRIWEHFGNAETEDQELFAQIYPLLYFKESGNSEALEVFRKLAKHQDARYNSWRSYQTKSLSEINEALHQVRNKQPLEVLESTEIRLGELFSPAVQYMVPLYQRDYIWSEEKWSLLWDGIKRISDLKIIAESSRHFTGVIILNPLEEGPANFPRYEIIDGHQRIATFQIIFAVIRDLCQSADYQDIAEKANPYLLNSFSIVPQENPNDKYKFLPHSTDSDTFYAIVDSCPPKNEHHPMFQAYQYFKTQIAAYVNSDPEKIRNLLDSLLCDFALIKITLGSSDSDASEIFESVH